MRYRQPGEDWQARRESNPQPAVLETAALPIELLACICFRDRPLQAACTTAGAMIAKGTSPGNPSPDTLLPRGRKRKGEPRLAFSIWSSWTDLNRRPHPYQGCALPLSYMSTTCGINTRYLERAAGIEPASSAWKAEVLPLNYARLPTLAASTRRIACGQTWWRGKDSNLRSFRGRFTVCSLWPLGNPSNWRCILPPLLPVSSL